MEPPSVFKSHNTSITPLTTLSTASFEIRVTGGSSWGNAVLFSTFGAAGFEIKASGVIGNGCSVGVMSDNFDVKTVENGAWDGYHMSQDGQISMHSEEPEGVKDQAIWGGEAADEIRFQYHAKPVPSFWVGLDGAPLTMLPLRKAVPDTTWHPCVCLAGAHGSCLVSFARHDINPDLHIFNTAFMQNMWLQRDFADASVTCKGARFPVHRCMLCAASPVFKGTFGCGMKESQTSTVEIEDTSPEAVELMLHYIYTGSRPLVDNVADVMLIAHRYELGGLMRMCIAQMVHGVQDNNVGKTIQVLELLKDDPDVENAIVELMQTVKKDDTLLRTLMKHVRA